MPILTRGDIERINEESLRVLWETGVQFDDDAVVSLLRERGCAAEAGRVVRIPREVVAASLKRCPGQVRLASLVWGIGNLESTKCMSREMAVIGNDIAGALRRAAGRRS
jgi:trimethylamine:corrinoid methyltransferase-like protein